MSGEATVERWSHELGVLWLMAKDDAPTHRVYTREEADALEAVVAAVRPYAASKLHQDLVRALGALDALRSTERGAR